MTIISPLERCRQKALQRILKATNRGRRIGCRVRLRMKSRTKRVYRQSIWWIWEVILWGTRNDPTNFTPNHSLYLRTSWQVYTGGRVSTYPRIRNRNGSRTCIWCGCIPLASRPQSCTFGTACTSECPP